MAYNKFIKNDGTIMLDLTDTTVSSATLGKDITAVDKYGNKIVGTLTDSPIPIEVSTEEEMVALLESGEISSVYKYVGTTGAYENNALYELTSESDPLKGTWVWNDTLSTVTYMLTPNINFSCNNTLYDKIYLGTSGSSTSMKYSYSVDSADGVFVYRRDWEDEIYKSIEITSTYEELISLNSENAANNFFTYLQANATKQEEVTKSFTKLILQSDLEEITITENGEYSGEYSKVNADVNTFPTYIATKEKPNDFSKLFYKSTINDTQLNTLMNGLDTSNVTNMQSMFYYCTNLTTIPQLDTGNVTNMSDMFNFCENLITIPQLDTSNVTNMHAMFLGCTNLTSIPQLDTGNVTDMSYMFPGCVNLTTIPLFDTSNVTNMRDMFNGHTSLTSIPQLDTSNVTDMQYMFYSCTNLTTIPLLDTSNVTNMYSMFSGCTNLTSIPQLDTSNVTNIDYMFADCTNLTTIPPLDVSNVTDDMNSMFWGCTNLTSVTFTNMENTTGNYGDIFYDCTNLKSLIMSGAKQSFNISYSTQFETQDLVNLIDSLGTSTASGMNKPRLFMGSTNLAKLTDEQKAVATAKGWILQ